ncbi:hypothetical protein B4N84_05515 [Flavobacterium sp. IR1]|nr:hypothetical protein B4N84_05515 [Flavobacterium sp. IR1]
MKFKNIVLLLILVVNFSFGQNNIKLTSSYGSSNQETQKILDFENINIEQLDFEAKDLKGKQYLISLQEFTDGKLVNKSVLFDGFEGDYFKIKGNKESLNFLFKMTEGKLKAQIASSRFSSKKSYFDLKDNADNYALKDFFGSKKELFFNPTEETAILAIITPTKLDNGNSSYCEVVQSDIKPEKLGEHFKIPHYFLITILFK